MAKTWRFTDTDSDIPRSLTYSKAMADVGSGTILQQASSGGSNADGAFTHPLGISLAGQSNTGTWTVVLNVSSAASNTTAQVFFERTTPPVGTVQASIPASEGAISTATTGDKTFTVTNPALGTWAATDRFAVRVRVTNNNAHGGSSGPTFDLAATNTRVDTPFTLDSATAMVDPMGMSGFFGG